MMLLSLFLFFLLFFNTENFLLLCRESILLWYDKLLPTLFPAMIASNLILYHLQGKSKFEKYVIPIGFLAGFPMGSYLVGKLTKENKISESKGSWLLSFCNNIGPVFFINIFLQPVSAKNKITAFAIFYGIPLLYRLREWSYSHPRVRKQACKYTPLFLLLLLRKWSPAKAYARLPCLHHAPPSSPIQKGSAWSAHKSRSDDYKKALWCQNTRASVSVSPASTTQAVKNGLFRPLLLRSRQARKSRGCSQIADGQMRHKRHCSLLFPNGLPDTA